ncbi:hypothetical protein HYT57_05570 [Candidatus Woesearchaeota archaeon]|nr:hypothetical protein [Candidatus Woesearchaeota archaeon]
MANYSFLRLSGEPFVLKGLEGEILYENRETVPVIDKTGIVRGLDGEILYGPKPGSREPIVLQADTSVEVPTSVVRKMLSNYMGGGLSHHIPNAIQAISGWMELRKLEQGSNVVLEDILLFLDGICREIKKANDHARDYGEYLSEHFYANSFSIVPYLEARWQEFIGSMDVDSMRKDIFDIDAGLLMLNKMFSDEYTQGSIDVVMNLLYEFDYLTNLSSFELDEAFTGSPIIKIPKKLQS